MRTLDKKLAAIRAGTYKPTDFIIADAKDGDIGFGRAAPVPDPRQSRPLHAARDASPAIRDMTRSGLVDIMLMSASTGERLSNEGPVRRQPGHPGDPPQRHHRHLVGARRPLQGGAVAAPPHRAGRPGARSMRPRPLLGDLLQPARHRCGERRGLLGLPRRGGRTRDAPLPRGVQSGLRHQARRRAPTSARSSTTTSSAPSPA